MEGVIFNIQRCCVHDGPGIRTTVFFKGCNLRCAWCHNPESFSHEPELSQNHERCTDCGQCAATCPNGAHTIAPHSINRQACIGCGACVAVCPSGALELIGKRYTLDDVMSVIRKDARYYQASGGGVTCSGGEPTQQFDFLLAMLTACKAEGISTCVETNGILPVEQLEQLVAVTDLFLVDFKHSDDALHKQYTGASNRQVLATLSWLSDHGGKVILRCPILPTINDTDAHLNAIEALTQQHSAIIGMEYMPYHDTGVPKWQHLGMEYKLDITVADK